MNEIEDNKFSCVCGSEVKEANRKAHEKTKKHTNFLLANGSSSSGGFNNVMPTKNLPVPRQPRKKYVRQVEEEDEDDYEDDEQGDEDGVEHEDGDEEDDGFEEELLHALEVIHKGIEDLVTDKVNLRNDFRLNLRGIVTDVGFLLNPLLDDIKYRLKCIEDKLTSQVPTANSLEQPKWINDKCTQRN